MIAIKKHKEGYVLSLSIKVIIVTTIIIILFGIYLGVLIYGENSLTVLSQLKRTEKNLLKEAQQLKSENQRLQKESFELKQLATSGE